MERISGVPAFLLPLPRHIVDILVAVFLIFHGCCVEVDSSLTIVQLQ